MPYNERNGIIPAVFMRKRKEQYLAPGNTGLNK